MPVSKKAVWFLNEISNFFPDAKIELDYDKNDTWQLLVAVVLSAQTTDVMVNRVTPNLFKTFPDVYVFSKVSPSKVEPYIKQLGFFRNKSKKNQF